MYAWPIKPDDCTHCSNTLGMMRNIIVCSCGISMLMDDNSLLVVLHLSKWSRIEYLKKVGSGNCTLSMFMQGNVTRRVDKRTDGRRDNNPQISLKSCVVDNVPYIRT